MLTVLPTEIILFRKVLLKKIINFKTTIEAVVK